MAPERLPERRLVGPDRLLLRRWVTADAELLAVAVAESLAHLRPWMPWVAQEPLSLQRRRAMIEKWEQDWLRGGDVVMGGVRGSARCGRLRLAPPDRLWRPGDRVLDASCVPAYGYRDDGRRNADGCGVRSAGNHPR